jgi:hypothetical protein
MAKTSKKKLNQYGLEEFNVPRDPRTGQVQHNSYSDIVEYDRDANGKNILLPTGGYQTTKIPVKLTPNHPFQAELLISSMSIGQNSLDIRFHDSVLNISYYMNLPNFRVLVEKAVIDKGVVKGNWEFSKNGHRIRLLFLD